jgi:hypothetical protein
MGHNIPDDAILQMQGFVAESGRAYTYCRGLKD